VARAPPVARPVARAPPVARPVARATPRRRPARGRSGGAGRARCAVRHTGRATRGRRAGAARGGHGARWARCAVGTVRGPQDHLLVMDPPVSLQAGDLRLRRFPLLRQRRRRRRRGSHIRLPGVRRRHVRVRDDRPWPGALLFRFPQRGDQHAPRRSADGREPLLRLMSGRHTAEIDVGRLPRLLGRAPYARRPPFFAARVRLSHTPASRRRRVTVCGHTSGTQPRALARSSALRRLPPSGCAVRSTITCCSTAGAVRGGGRAVRLAYCSSAS